MVLPHEHELVKATVHGALLTLATTCAVYNMLAWWKRPAELSAHSLSTSLLYTSLALFECEHVYHHWRIYHGESQSVRTR